VAGDDEEGLMDDCTCTCGCAPDGGRTEATSTDAGTRGAPLASVLGDERGAVSRRGVLAGSAAALAALALGACASEDEAGAEGSSPEGTPTAEEPTASESASESAPSGADPTGEVLAGTGEFPVGGGKVVTVGGAVVVVTQPADGQFEAFNGKCPHAGCPVAEVTENTIVCNCHGSTFDGSTGDRLEGPAPTGLQPVEITVEGDSIYLA
jgi:nitrite reductase/ring-hydroxylating ferredoxin subunit